MPIWWLFEADWMFLCSICHQYGTLLVLSFKTQFYLTLGKLQEIFTLLQHLNKYQGRITSLTRYETLWKFYVSSYGEGLATDKILNNWSRNECKFILETIQMP